MSTILRSAVALVLAATLTVRSVEALQITQLTASTPPPYDGEEFEPAWSADGQWIAFSFNFWHPDGFDPYFGIRIIALTGAGGPLFEPPVWIFGHPTWSPDGTRIAFASGGLWIAPIADPYTVEPLLFGYVEQPVWSPVADRIAFARSGQIEIVPASGGTPTVVAMGRNPAWSADGSKLTFDSGGRIWVLDVATQTTTPITSGSTTDAHPTWSPDGGWIAFTSRRSGTAALWVVSSSGGGPFQLTTGATSDFDPTWSPDGESIAFTSDRGGDGRHLWLATDLPDFTVPVEHLNWTNVKLRYRH